MKTNFNIEKNVRNSRSINALCALRKLQSLGLIACALLIGSLQVWGQAATLPVDYSFEAGSGSLPTGVTTHGLGSDYAAQHSPYLLKFDGTNDDLQIQVDAAAQQIIFGVKKAGGAGISSFQLSGSSNGSSWTDIESFTITGSQNDVVNCTTSVSINSSYRYFKLTFTKANNGNVGLGTLKISKAAASGYTVTINRNNSSYGTVSAASVTNVTSGTSISASSNVLSVGATNVTATPNSGYKFSSWTDIPGGGTVTGNVTVTANFAAVSYRNYRTSCATDDPSVSVTESLTDLGYILGNSPVAQTFSISGSNLTAGTLTITAPEHFQVSLDGSAWSASDGTGTKTITVSSATLSSTTIYVRLASGKSAGEYSGNVSISGCGLESAVNVALSGTVYTPTITADPASITGWNAVTGSAPSPATKAVEVTGVHLKADISVSLTSGSDYFSIDKSSFEQTSGSASGTITISVKAAAYASAATRNGNIRLTSTDATTVDVPITLLVQDDPREKFELLTSSNLSQLSDGAKLVLVYDDYDLLEETHTYYAMTTVQNGSNGHEQTTTGFEMLSTNTILAIAENNPQSVQVLELVETATDNIYALYTGSTKNTYLFNSASNKMNEAADFTNDNARWSITVDGDGYAIIDAQGGYTQQIGFNKDASGAKFRCYNSGYSIYAYFQPSTTPSISVSPTSLTGLGYVVGDGANSEIKSFTVTGMNLTGNLTVKAPTNYQVSTDGGSTWSTSGGTKTISASGTLSATTVKVRLVSGLSRGTYNDATGVKVYGGGVDEANAKTVSLAGNVTNAFHTVTISAGANGSVSPSGEQSVEEGQTLTVTPTPNTGYEFDSWTVTGTGSSCAGTTFTMGTANATLTANFSQIMVSSITVSGDATIKTSTSKTYTATVTPDGALTKTVTWSVINGTGTASINSSTGELTAGSPGTVTVRATANDGSGNYGELAVTVQDVVRYKYKRLTADPGSWDGEYVIAIESNPTTPSSGTATILKGSNPGESNVSGTNWISGVSITKESTDYYITLEDSHDDAFTIADGKIKGVGSNKYIYHGASGGMTTNTSAPSGTYTFAYNAVRYAPDNSTDLSLRYNSSRFRFYTTANNTGAPVRLYKLEVSYTVTCETPSNGTLTSDMGSAASGTTVTLTVTPNSGKELSSLTITKDGTGTVTPTKVDDTHYTFTMPADNVTVEATFVALQSKDIIFHTPSCVATPSTLSSQQTGATVTLPSEPATTPDDYSFEGWVLAEQVSPVAVKPTTYAPGDYIVPAGASNINMYALYSEGELTVSGSFSNITTAGNLTVPGYYIIGMASSGSQSVLSNTLSGKHIAPATINPGSCSSSAGVWEITKPDSYWRIRNIATGTYVASTGTEKELTLIDNASSDAAQWTVTATDAGYRFENKLLNANSLSKRYLSYNAGSTDYRTAGFGTGGDVLYLFKAGSGVVTDNTTYTTDPQCYCDYGLWKSTNGGSTWDEVGCFTKVKPNDASDHEWQLANFTMPAHDGNTLLKVLKNGENISGQTANWQSGGIPMAELQGTSCTYKAFELEGAVGTLRIFDNEGGNYVEPSSNLSLGFYPTYQIYHKNAAPNVWIDETFELVDAGTHKYQTAITTAPASYFDDNYQFYVGARKADGSTKFADKNSNEATSKSNTTTMKTMDGMTSDVGGRSGVYEIYSNSCDQNWNCQFIPYYVVRYYNVDGTLLHEDVLTSTTHTVRAYEYANQTGWATSQGGAADAGYAASTVITPSSDVNLYVVAPTYTVTYSVASETTVPAVNGTSVSVVQGQSVTLPTITFSCGLYDTFVGWVTGSDIAELNPAEKIDEPSTLVGVGGASYTPTGNVTLKALYAYDIAGNSGYQKQTTITPGTYLMATESGYVYAGQATGNGSTTDNGTYISGVTITDGVISSLPVGARTVTVSVNGSYFAIYNPDEGKYLEPSYSMTCSTGSSGGATGYLNATISDLADAYIWRLATAGQEDSYISKKGVVTPYTFNAGEAYAVVSACQCNTSGSCIGNIDTKVTIQSNNGNQQFRVYTHTQTPVYFYKLKNRGYYTTNPTCAIPTELTVTFHANPPAGKTAGDVDDVPTTIIRTFSSYPTLSSAIDFSGNSTPTCDGYTIQKWNTTALGNGTDYALDATISTYNGSALDLYAVWDRTYTVHFIDHGDGSGDTDTPRTQASAGATVSVPSNPTPCDTKPGVTWTFVGWGTQDGLAQSLNGHIEITAGTSTYTPSDDITLYAVYRKSTGTSDAFAVGTSGAYTIGAKQGAEYAECLATTKFGTGYYCSNDGSVPATIFYLNYVNSGEHNGQYTLQDGNTGEYVGYAGSSTSLSFSSTTPYYYNVVANGTGWNIQCSTATTRYFTHETGASASNFKAYQDNNPVTLHPAAASTYYTVASCDDDFNITFVENGSEITWQVNHGEGTYYHLSDGTEVSVFPTASFDGWTFLGWRTADYDESTTAPEASTIYGGSDGTTGNHFTIHANTNMYPVFTRFEDNEPFDEINGGDYFIYFLESGSDDGYGAEKRVYAKDYVDKKRYYSTLLCSEATEFTFTKLENGNWTIKDKKTGNYLYGEGSDEIKQRASVTNSEWTITVNSGNQFDAYYVGNDYGQLCAQGDGTSATFMNYRRTNIGTNPAYHRVFLGGCTNRTFTTNPSTTPNIEIHGEVKVTSTVGKNIKAASVLTVSASNIATANLTVSSDNSAFKFSLTSNGTYTASVNIPVVSNKVGVTPVYVEYTPTATEDGIDDVTVTVSDGDVTPTEVSTESGDVQGRHVPANFVIAAKWGDKWYALPANCTDNTSSTTGVLIEVDNASDPTTATYAPTYTKWGLQTVRPGRKADYGTRLVFTEQLTSATADEQKTLFNGSTTNIEANAQYGNYAVTNPDKYEWIPTTIDLKDYVLTSATTLGGDASARTVSLSNKGVFGTLLNNKAYDGKVRLLPATFIEPAEIQVVEWKASSVVVMYTGSGTKAITQLGDDAPSSAQSLSSANIDHGVFELTTGTLTSAKNEPLNITIQNGSDAIVGRKSLVVPAIVSGSQNAPLGLETDETKLTDVVVLDGATLSAAATKYTFKNITVYPGGKLVIGADKQLGMASLTLRGGSSWGAAEYEHKYPQFVLNNTTSGAFSNSAAVINYDYVTTKDQYYSFVLPYNGSTSAVKYPVDIYGSAVSASNTGSFEFQYYDGAARAAGGTGWKVLAEPATLVAGTGYTFLGMPKKVDAYDGTDDSHANSRQRYGIHRIPMSVAAATVQAGETGGGEPANKPIAINVTLASKNNDSGWNLVGNPYMANVSGLSNSDIQVGQLVHTSVVPWDGKWQWDDTNPSTGVRYIVTTDDGQNFESEQASTATLKAFKNFFVQIQNAEATSLVIPANTRTDKNLLPARYTNEVEKDIQLAIDLVSDERKDKVDLLINDIYTAEFDKDGDFTKMMNGTNLNLYGVYPDDYLSFIAVDKVTAEQSIAIGYQVPEAGSYTLQLSDREYVMADAVDALYVTDHEVTPEYTTDLLDDTYSFRVNQAEYNNTRFTITIKLKEKDEVATAIENIGTGDKDRPLKFLYRDKMYILRNGVLYDATGKKVSEINK